MVGDANDAIDFITDELIKIGSCTEFNKLYENVREPMCADLSSSVSWAVWLDVKFFFQRRLFRDFEQLCP